METISGGTALGVEEHVAALEAVERIKTVKHRYLRACDRKDPEGFRACFVAEGTAGRSRRSPTPRAVLSDVCAIVRQKAAREAHASRPVGH